MQGERTELKRKVRGGEHTEPDVSPERSETMALGQGMKPRAPATFCDYWCSQTKQPTRTRSTESPLALDLHIDRPLLVLFKVDGRRPKTMFFFKRMYTPACRRAAWCSEPWPRSCSGCRPSTSTLEGAGRVPGARGWSARPPQQPEHPT